MVTFKILVNIIFPMAFLCFASQVCSQSNLLDDSVNGNFARCKSESYCTPIRRCLPYIQRGESRTVGVTCGYGSGAYRRVCCPIPRITKPPTPTVRTNPCGIIPVVNKESRFVGTGEGNEGTWPWLAAIKIKERSGGYAHWCAGFLIDKRHVVSAAHCFERKETDLYKVTIGSVDRDAGEESAVTRIVVPDGYKTNFYYDDIAILTLSREVNSPTFVPVCLPDDQIINMNLTGTGTTAVGWGAQSPYGPPTRYLNELKLMPVQSNRDCNHIFQTHIRNFQRQFPRGWASSLLCAGFSREEGDACGVESGSPLMFPEKNRWFVIGIASFGLSCAEPGIPGGYTRVTRYLDWIKKNTAD